jgi:predicted nuclease of predicted toxin-antitoxin system
MKLLLDSCVWGKAAEKWRDAGHDVAVVADWPGDPGDEIILAEAHADARILVTLDKDFGELAVARGYPHGGIIRLVNISARQQETYCLRVLEQYGGDLASGAIATVEPGRIRIRS